MRKFIGSVVVVLVAFTIATAEEFSARVTKIDKEKGEITFTKGGGGFGKGKGKKAEPTTMKFGDKVKFTKAKASFADGKVAYEADGDYPDGAAGLAKAVEEAAKKAEENKDKDKDKGKGKKGKGGFGQQPGVGVRIVTEGEGDNAKITEIKVVTFQKKKADAE